MPLVGYPFHMGYHLDDTTWSMRQEHLVLDFKYQRRFFSWGDRLEDFWNRIRSSSYRTQKPWRERERLEFKVEELTANRLVLSQTVDGQAEPAMIELERRNAGADVP